MSTKESSLEAFKESSCEALPQWRRKLASVDILTAQDLDQRLTDFSATDWDESLLVFAERREGWSDFVAAFAPDKGTDPVVAVGSCLRGLAARSRQLFDDACERALSRYAAAVKDDRGCAERLEDEARRRILELVLVVGGGPGARCLQELVLGESASPDCREIAAAILAGYGERCEGRFWDKIDYDRAPALLYQCLLYFSDSEKREAFLHYLANHAERFEPKERLKHPIKKFLRRVCRSEEYLVGRVAATSASVQKLVEEIGELQEFLWVKAALATANAGQWSGLREVLAERTGVRTPVSGRSGKLSLIEEAFMSNLIEDRAWAFSFADLAEALISHGGPMSPFKTKKYLQFDFEWFRIKAAVSRRPTGQPRSPQTSSMIIVEPRS